MASTSLTSLTSLQGPHRDGKLALLASLPVFAGCRRRDLLEVGKAVETLAACPAELVQRQHEPSGWWTIVAEGNALATVDGIPTAMLRPGDSFGTPGVALERRVSGVTVMALTPMVLFAVDPRWWRDLVDCVPELPEVAARAVGGPGAAPGAQPDAPAPRKNRSKSPSTPAPCSVIPPSTTMV